MTEYDVKSAALLLDQYGPEKWWDKIETSRLHMFDGTQCILGQLYGSYSNATSGPDRLPWLPEKGDPLFEAFGGVGHLKEQWVEEINKRRNRVNNNNNTGPEVYVTLKMRRAADEGTHIYESTVNGTTYSFAGGDVVDVKPVPWKLRKGDVYLRGDIAYRIDSTFGVLSVEATGLSDSFNPAEYGFTEDELIYRPGGN